MAERHQRVLCEMQEAALAVTRVYADLAIASAQAAKATLAPDAWHPELERAQAIGASRHAAEAFHRVTRALRLTMAMERAVVEIMRGVEAGSLAGPSMPIFTAAFLAPGGDIPPLTSDSAQTCGEAKAASREARGDDVSFDQRDLECLAEIERGDRVGHLKIREALERICAEIGVKPDWSRWDGEAVRSQNADANDPKPNTNGP